MSTTVIIGHGRSPEGRGWGSKIDLASTVVRMWDCGGWQDEADYGKKYDYGLFEIGGDLLTKMQTHKKRDPAMGWIASWLGGPTYGVPKDTEIIDQRPWNAIGKQLGGIGDTGRLQFTRGTIAACWAIERSKAGDSIVLVGFDNIHGGVTLKLNDAFCPVYQKNPGTFSFTGYKGGATKYGNHDYAIERPVLSHLAEKHSVELSFSQDVW